MRIDLKRHDAFGDRVHDAMDRATIGIMTASLVIGSSIVMTIAGGPTVFGVPCLPTAGWPDT
jgi:ubiquinone biosynthesis protein